jgi:hypothetical protein
MTALSRQSRAILLGSLFALLAILCAGAIATVELAAAWRSLEARHAELVGIERRLSGNGQHPVPAGSGPFLEGGTFSLAANALQRRLVSLIEASGATLLMASVDGPSEDSRSDHRAAVQVIADMTIEGLQQVLYALEGEPPLVIVTGLMVERSAPPAEGAPAVTSRLRVDLRAVGHFYSAGR